MAATLRAARPRQPRPREGNPGSARRKPPPQEGGPSLDGQGFRSCGRAPLRSRRGLRRARAHVALVQCQSL